MQESRKVYMEEIENVLHAGKVENFTCRTVGVFTIERFTCRKIEKVYIQKK